MATVQSQVQGLAYTSRNWLGGLGITLLVTVLFWLSGPSGLVVGIVVAVLWYWLSGIAAVAVGHVLLLPLVSTITEPGSLFVLEASFLAILSASTLRFEDPVRPLGVTAGAGLALGLFAWFGWAAWEPRWLVGLVLVLTVTLAVYGLHRYQVVRFELEEVERLS